MADRIIIVALDRICKFVYVARRHSWLQHQLDDREWSICYFTPRVATQLSKVQLVKSNSAYCGTASGDYDHQIYIVWTLSASC